MRIFYRISDKSYEKTKLPGASKWTCLRNFIETFQDHQIKIIADNCTEETLQKINNYFDIKITNLGNAGSLKYCIESCFKSNDEDIIYFVEDDYLHLPESPELIQEGLQIAEYVTLYDHPDKYTAIYEGGETSKVVRTKSSHWRYTISTCMTFACKMKTIKDDFETWCKFISSQHPDDHGIFSELNKNRRLAVSIPGRACHTDLTFSSQMGNILIDNWAIDLMIDKFSKKLFNYPDLMKLANNIHNKWDKLKMLDAITLEINKKHL